MKKFLLITTLIIVSQISILAQTAISPSVGDGSELNPYQISSLENLYWISQNSSEWNKYFIQIADIDASETSSWFSSAGWIPIGNTTTNFTGNYDGQNFKIVNLFINRSGTNYIGLFGYVSGATITNLGVTNSNIKGRYYVGGLTGTSIGASTITNCFSSGLVTAANDYAGGLIGLNDGASTISNCSSSDSVSGNNYVGGLIGRNQGSSIVENCFSTGGIYGGANSGGLIGYGNHSIIKKSYSIGNVYGGFNLGGLIGESESTSSIENSYALGSVTGTDASVGGLVGFHYNSSTITNCYSTGKVTGTSNVGGFIGRDLSGTTITNSFWDTETSETTDGVGSVSPDPSGVSGKTSAEMKTESIFTNAGWDFTNVWQMFSENYPDLKSNENPLLPVELTSFSADRNGASIKLSWETATEINNYAFEIERSSSLTGYNNYSWNKIATVFGNGNSNSIKYYSYADNKVTNGKYFYRLKQIDMDGHFTYSHIVEVDLGIPSAYKLFQNYPNPFNPSTVINYEVPEDSKIQIKIYNILGSEVAALVNEYKSAGLYEINFNASKLSSGVYIYKINAIKNNKILFSSSKQMMLIK